MTRYPERYQIITILLSGIVFAGVVILAPWFLVPIGSVLGVAGLFCMVMDRPQGVILDRVDPSYYPEMKAAAQAEREDAANRICAIRNAKRILNQKGQ
jgi:hypothetical protein